MTSRGKVIPARLPREVYQALEDIVGSEWVTEDRAICETYSKTSIEPTTTLLKHQKDPSIIPACVVLPENTGEVQAIVRVANRYRVPFVPFANGQSGCLPTKPGTMCIHLRRMDKILNIDIENMTATVEAFVDYGQLQAEAMKLGLWNGGAPLSTSLCKLASHFAAAGMWQTDLKFGGLSRNIVSVKVVLATGEVLKTGSAALAGAGDFWDHSPGPDLITLFRQKLGAGYIVTEITLKLHPWVGEPYLPEPPGGRPSIPTYAEAKYDSVPLPKRHRIYWIEFPNLQAEVEALYKIAHSGVGIGLNAVGVYSEYYCSQTQELTEKRVRENFFPKYNCYVLTAGVSSEKQLEYEEKVIRQIVSETGGKILSENYKPDVLKALAPWNADAFRNVCGYRMNRRGYGGYFLPLGPIDIVFEHTKYWCDILERLGPVHVTDRGGCGNTPFLYVTNRGHYVVSESDNYPNFADPKELEKCVEFITDAEAAWVVGRKQGPSFLQQALSEPFTSLFPESGPNAYLLYRKFRKVLDPNGVSAPGRIVYDENEFKAIPEAVKEFIMKARALHGGRELKLAPSGDKWD